MCEVFAHPFDAHFELRQVPHYLGTVSSVKHVLFGACIELLQICIASCQALCQLLDIALRHSLLQLVHLAL